MSFGLKNAGMTYQRLVNKMFANQIGKTMEVYINDMLVKSKVVESHIEHLGEMFNILRRYRVKLNPLKCAFGVSSGKFLGFLINQRGVEANPEKIQALLDMKSLTSIRDRAGLLLESLEENLIRAAIRFGFAVANNEAEYDALLVGIRLTKKMGADSIKIYSDSQLVVHQIIGEYQPKEDMMASYLQLVEIELKQFQSFTILQIQGEKNSVADALACLASAMNQEKADSIPVKFLPRLSISAP
ncbi:uncharacterized protein LOC116126804 [Pistacia vera]|uniref:uncharacterized protein LOC116126804 n=1 Tax=Pistacia vera TaxID=55513 RepID=UPI00126367BF|nr:uncharacterized protein LOC116126804 [Pistacia vera]